MTRRHHAFVLALVTFACTLLTSCGGDTMEAADQLKARRPAARAQADNLALLDEVRAALSTVAPHLQWRTDASAVESGSTCKAPFDGVEGATSAILTSGGALGAVPDPDWPTAWGAVKEVAAKAGYRDENVLLDKPGEHQVSLYDADGAELSVGTGVNTTATIYGGCHLG